MGSIWPSVIWEVVMPLLVVVDDAPWACRKGGAPGGTDSGVSDDSTPMASNWSTCLVERLAGKQQQVCNGRVDTCICRAWVLAPELGITAELCFGPRWARAALQAQKHCHPHSHSRERH